MNLKICYLFTSLIVFQTYSYASGNRVGNGGDVVACRDSYQILDFYEKGLSPSLGASLGAATGSPTSSQTDPWQIAKDKLKTLESLNKRQADQYLRRVDTMKSQVEFVSNVALTDVKDSLHYLEITSRGCQLHQLAIRKDVASSESSLFVIDKELFDKLPPIQQAGLIVHEIVYEHFFLLGETDSRKAREFNAMLFSGEFSKMTADKYAQIFTNWKLPIYR